MSGPETLQSLEARAYQRAYSDGIIDLFVGISLVWIGSAWIWLPDLAGIAGVFPAVLAVTVIGVRKRFVESRLGYVRWAQPRRERERRNLIAMFAAGLLLFLGGIVVFIVVEQGLADRDVMEAIAPGLLAWLLALLFLGIAYLMESWRFVLYSVVLTAAGVVTAWQDANPGWPLFMAGWVVAVTGSLLLARFMSENPRPENP